MHKGVFCTIMHVLFVFYKLISKNKLKRVLLSRNESFILKLLRTFASQKRTTMVP